MSSTSFTQESGGYEVVEGEPPELLGRNLVSASYLLGISMLIFLFNLIYSLAFAKVPAAVPAGAPAGRD